MAGRTYDEAWLTQQLQKPGYRLVHGSVATTPAPGREDARVSKPGGAMTEADLLAQVVRLAKAQGWLAYHTWRSDHSEAGFPDLVLVKPGSAGAAGRLIFAELKSRSGKLTPAQHTWLDLLRHTLPSVEVYTWKPQDWATITSILTRKDPGCCAAS